MTHRLIITESPAKIRALRRASNQIWPQEDVHILSTNGNLMEMDPRHLSIHPVTLLPEEWIYTKAGRLFVGDLNRWLRSHPAGVINILTDPDFEGENIARQILRLSYALAPDSTVVRGRLSDLSPETLREVHWEPGVDSGVVAARSIRRALDRLVPFLLAKRVGKDKYSGMGRVQNAALSLFGKRYRTYAAWRVEGMRTFADGKTWMANAAFTSQANAQRYSEALGTFKASSAPLLSQKSEVIPPPPAHTFATLVTSPNLPHCLEDIVEAAQSLYQKGLASYIRSDNHELSPIQKRVLALAISNHGLMPMTDPTRLSPSSTDNNENRRVSLSYQKGHTGICPTVEGLRCAGDSLTSVEADVLREITVRASASVMEPAHLIRASYQVVAGAPALDQIQVQTPGWLVAYHRQNMIAPGFAPACKKWKASERKPTHKDMADWLFYSHLGRPSTVARYPKALQQMGLMGANGVTSSGQEHLQFVKDTCPALVSVEFTHEIEKHAHTLLQNPDYYRQGVIVAAERLGFPSGEVLDQIRIDYESARQTWHVEMEEHPENFALDTPPFGDF